jgi:hypothetical protein
MTKSACVILLGAVVCVAGGCAKELGPKTSEMVPKPASVPPSTPDVDGPVPAELPQTYARQEVTARKVVDESREAYEAATQFAAQSRDEFIAEARQRLIKIDAKIEDYERRLNDRSQEFTAEAREKSEMHLVDLKRHREDMQKKLDELSRDSGAAWKELSAGAHKSWSEMSKAFRAAAAAFDKPEREDAPRE